VDWDGWRSAGGYQPEHPSVLFRLLRVHVRPYRGSVALIVLLQCTQVGGTLLLPALGAALIDNGVVKQDSGYVSRVGAMMVAIALVQVGGAVAAARLNSRTSMGMGRDMRSKLFRRVLDFSAREVSAYGTPSLLTRTVNDVQQVQSMTMSFFGVAVSAPVMCLGSIGLALVQDVPLSLLLVGLVVAIGLVFGLMLRRMGRFYQRMQQHLDRLNGLVREQITGVRVIRSFVRDTHERERFGATNRDLLETSRHVSKVIASMLPVVLILMNGFTVLLLSIGARRIDAGSMKLGALSAFLNYVTLILMAVVMLALVFLSVPRAQVAARRILQVLDTELTLTPPTTPVRTHRKYTGQLELRGVEFRYPGAESPVLRAVNLLARPGQTVAILGSTGSGKTTLLSLAMRLMDATAGSVRINGADVRDLDPPELTSTVGLVPQRPYLFSGTVESNLRFGKLDATEEELWEALRIAQAEDFVSKMPGKLGAEISQGGTNISGGQRQRLSIARTLLRKPAVYLFDDCFSALDQATDAALRTALAPLTEKATVLTVAQRVATVRNADRIVVLDEGRIVGAGRHEELMRGNTTYQEIAFSQLTREELADGLVER
jgi:ATP-binding cassette subfamily B multidrug efflux pump